MTTSKFELMQAPRSMVAKGIQITNRSFHHGHEFNVRTHLIFQLTEVADAK